MRRWHVSEAVQSRPKVMVERDARPGAAGKVGDEPRRRPPSRSQFGFRLGSVARVEIRVDWSLAIIVWLIVVSLAMGRFPSLHPDWSAGMVWSVALIAAVFMQLRERNALNRMAASVGPIWLFIVFLLIGADYVTR